MPPQESNDAADEGTEAHKEIEMCLGPWNDRADTDPCVIEVYADPEHPAAYGINLVLSFVRQLPPGILWVEQRVRLTDQIWGRCDVAHWDATTAVLTIIDYKNGYVDVQAEENEQLQIYAAATIFEHQLPAKWIRLVIVQPNSFMPVPRVKQWVTTSEALYAFASKAASIPTGPLTFTAGEHCKYCPVFSMCPPTQDLLTKLGTAMCQAPDMVRPDQVAPYYALRKPIDDWFKTLDKIQTQKAIKSGSAPPGMKIITTIKHRVWLSESAARDYVVAQRGVAALSPPTPVQAEKLGLIVDSLCDRPQGSPALAFESDSRKPWEPKTVTQMFAGVK